MKKLLQFGNVLSKDQQRKIIGGDYGDGSCIFCSGSGQACGNGLVSSCWYRTSPDAHDCEQIYSGCSVWEGTVGPCQSHCHMN